MRCLVRHPIFELLLGCVVLGHCVVPTSLEPRVHRTGKHDSAAEYDSSDEALLLSVLYKTAQFVVGGFDFHVGLLVVVSLHELFF